MHKKNSFRKKTAFLKGEFENFLEDYLNRVDKEKITNHRLILDSWQETVRLLKNGGKRLRPVLMLLAYEASGKKNIKRIMPVALAIEFLHTFFLIHDDIIDNGQLRHGTPTLGEVYRKNAKIFAKEKKAASHFGNSIALLLGDRLMAEAFRVILESQFSVIQKNRILKELVEMVRVTICGETLDVMASFPENYDFTEIKKMTAQTTRSKTGYYTFVVPLKLGATLGNLSKNQLDVITEIGYKLGEIFQWQDDLLDIFSDLETLGKPAGADLQEKKPTLLLIYALEKLNLGDKDKLKKNMGRALTPEKLNQARQLIKKSGAEKRIKKKIDQSVKKLNRIIEFSSLSGELKNTLLETVRSLLARTF